MGVKWANHILWQKKNTPKLFTLRLDHDYYKYVSDQVMNVLKDFSPYVEIYSIDEAFVDLTGLKNCTKKITINLQFY